MSRCKDLKLYMEEAVSTINAFTATHSSYAMYLKNTDAALSDYAHSDVSRHHHHSHSVLSLFAASPPHPLPPLTTRFQSDFWGRGFLDILAENPDQQAKQVMGFGVFIFLI